MWYRKLRVKIEQRRGSWDERCEDRAGLIDIIGRRKKWGWMEVIGAVVKETPWVAITRGEGCATIESWDLGRSSV